MVDDLAFNGERRWLEVAIREAGSDASFTALVPRQEMTPVATVKNGHLYTSSDAGETWTAREEPREWREVASSADDTKLAAVAEGGHIVGGGAVNAASGHSAFVGGAG